MDYDYDALLERCKLGDNKAFKQLYQASSPQVYGVLLTLLKEKTLAEDVLQEAYLTIWQRAKSFDTHKGKAITWMMTVARNKGLDKLRALQVRPELNNERNEEIEDLINDKLSPELETIDKQTLKQVLACLANLSEEQQNSVVLSYYYGYTNQELALRLNKPLGTVKSWVRRGLDNIRECLQ